MYIHRFILLLPLLVLGACTGPKLDALRTAALPDDPFAATLAAQYRTLAEADGGADGEFYANKGLDALYGKEVTPESPDAWTLAPADLGRLTEAHAALTGALAGARKTAPQAAANAVVFYDCWVVESARADAENAALCEQGFTEAMVAVVRPSTPVETGVVPGDIPLSTSFLIFFGWDEASLNDAAIEAVTKTLAYITQLRDAGYEVVVNGHTDTSGEDSYNLTLSNARADVVKQALVRAGIAMEKITTFGFGESDPRVKTPDGVREPANRRVEIFIE